MISFTSLATSAILWTATPSPEPTLYPAYEGDPNLVTPGVLGFIGILFVAVATLFIVMDMNRRVRRVRYRALAQETIQAEQAAAAGETDGLTDADADGAAGAGDADDAAPTQRAD
ncbi:hypothetical protein I6E52_11985 [Salinibacterium sp. NG253]|uniref:hypothetical protein n=1 Tax=Salinibacterium sp. NG253 TaxID=2792039 RepID=UPI0018CFD0E5|nr:hypothetical protein [Salinibacterium sp. NG253]MBH0117559.1 hypothetical protein [Salinibacterium sp. NG253]